MLELTRVLLVESTERTPSNLFSIFNSLNLSIELKVCRSGKDSIGFLRETGWSPDIAFVDHELSDMTGERLLYILSEFKPLLKCVLLLDPTESTDSESMFLPVVRPVPPSLVELLIKSVSIIKKVTYVSSLVPRLEVST